MSATFWESEEDSEDLEEWHSSLGSCYNCKCKGVCGHFCTNCEDAGFIYEKEKVEEEGTCDKCTDHGIVNTQCNKCSDGIYRTRYGWCNDCKREGPIDGTCISCGGWYAKRTGCYVTSYEGGTEIHFKTGVSEDLKTTVVTNIQGWMKWWEDKIPLIQLMLMLLLIRLLWLL